MLSLTRETKSVCSPSMTVVLALLLALSAAVFAQQAGQKTFDSPEAAAGALFAAAQSGDKTALLDIFGPAGSEIVSSGDEVQDKNTRDEFVAKYQEMHRIAEEPDGTSTLYIGAENWPMPVPLVEKAGVWYFDTEEGKQDILFRRIGRNEFATIDICRALVDAQKEYYSQPRDGKVQQYAQVFASDEGKHNGLFWRTSEGEPMSPIGQLIVEAAGEGYRKPEEGRSSPFHGYYYRILTGQGKGAPGGSRSYIVNGEMTRGFAFLAYPADYRSSGVMTFIVNQDGVIYEKDLGPRTAEIAGATQLYAPDKSWQAVE